MRMKGLWFMFITLCFCLQAAAQVTAEDYAKKGIEKYNKKDYNEAIKLFKIAQTLDTLYFEYTRYVSGCYVAMGEYKKSDNNMDSLTIRYPNSWGAYVTATAYFTENKYFDKALNLMQYATNRLINESDSVRAYLYGYLGQAKYDLQDFEGALKDYKTAHKLDTANTESWFDLAKTYADLNKIDSATYYYKKIERKEPDDIGLYISWGFLNNKLGMYNEAIVLYNKCLRNIAKKNAKGEQYSIVNTGLLHSNYGFALFKIGDYKKAMVEFKKSIECYPSNSYVYRNRALLYIEQKKYDEACKDLNFAIALGFADQYGTEVDDLLNEHCR